MSARAAVVTGRVVEAAASAVAVGLALVACARFGVGRHEAAWMMVGASPLVGEFAATMAYRYSSGMSLADAGARLLRPSSCDSCSLSLTQWDIVPVVPYLARRGRCSCGAFKVPATCTLAGLATLVLSAAALAASLALDVDPVPAVALALALAPAVVADLAHGEVDEWLLAPPVLVGLAVMPHDSWTGPAMALLLAANVWLSAVLSKWMTGLDVLPTGRVDVVAAGATGLFMDLPDAVNSTVWLLAATALTHVVVRIPAVRRRLPRGDATYGHEPDEDGLSAPTSLAVPYLPAILAAGVLGILVHVV